VLGSPLLRILGTRESIVEAVSKLTLRPIKNYSRNIAEHGYRQQGSRRSISTAILLTRASAWRKVLTEAAHTFKFTRECMVESKNACDKMGMKELSD